METPSCYLDVVVTICHLYSATGRFLVISVCFGSFSQLQVSCCGEETGQGSERIVVAVAIWGKQWVARLPCLSTVWQHGGGACPQVLVMHLLTSLYFLLAEWDIALQAEHILGVLNITADAISCNLMQVFWQVGPDRTNHCQIRLRRWKSCWQRRRQRRIGWLG